MKRRVRKIANFFAFNLLFFALYLNFIHQDKSSIPAVPHQKTTPAFSGTVLVDAPQKEAENKPVPTAKAQQTTVSGNENNLALKLSIN